MKISNKKIESIIYIVFLALIPFQDTAMRNTALGFLGCYLSIIPLALLTVYHFCTVKEVKIPKKFLICSAWMLTLSLTMMIFEADKGYMNLMIYKIGTNFIIYILFCLTVYFTYHVELATLKVGVFIAFLIHVSSVVVSDIMLINDGFLIHSSYIEYGRLRGFCSESSWFAYTLVILGSMLFALMNNKIIKTLVLILIITLTISSGSKGGIICLLLVCAIMLYRLTNNRLLKSVTIMLFVIGCIFLLPAYFWYLFKDDITNYTSFATRSSTLVSALWMLFKYPLGTGFGAFTLIFRDNLMDSLRWVENLVGLHLNSSEIERMVYMDIYEKGVTIKSIIFQWTTFFGVPFVYVFIKKIRKYYIILKRKNEKFLCLMAIYLLIANLTYSSFMFESCVMIGFIILKTSKNPHERKLV